MYSWKFWGGHSINIPSVRWNVVLAIANTIVDMLSIWQQPSQMAMVENQRGKEWSLEENLVWAHAKHNGMSSMLQRLRSRGWHAKIAMVEMHVREHQMCQQCRRISTQSPWGTIKFLTLPCYVIGMDLLGPVSRTSESMEYIITVIEHSTRYEQTTACNFATTQVVLETLMRWIEVCGQLDTLISEQGTNFKSLDVFYACRNLGI